MGIFQKRKNKHRKLLLFLCILIACMFLWTKDGKAENNEVTPEILRVGYSAKFLNDVSLADAQVAIELWTRQLTNNAALKMQPKPYIYDDLQSMVHALKNREIDFIAITAMDYLKIKDKVPLEPTLVGNKWRATHGDELVLVVRREQQITDIARLS